MPATESAGRSHVTGGASVSRRCWWSVSRAAAWAMTAIYETQRQTRRRLRGKKQRSSDASYLSIHVNARPVVA